MKRILAGTGIAGAITVGVTSLALLAPASAAPAARTAAASKPAAAPAVKAPSSADAASAKKCGYPVSTPRVHLSVSDHQVSGVETVYFHISYTHSGCPIRNRTITIYNSEGQAIGTITTNSEGQGRLKYMPTMTDRYVAKYAPKPHTRFSNTVIVRYS